MPRGCGSRAVELGPQQGLHGRIKCQHSEQAGGHAQVDADMVAEVAKLGFDRDMVVDSLRKRQQNKARRPALARAWVVISVAHGAARRSAELLFG